MRSARREKWCCRVPVDNRAYRVAVRLLVDQRDVLTAGFDGTFLSFKRTVLGRLLKGTKGFEDLA